MAKCRLADWQAESLRLSAFMAEAMDPTKLRFWESLVGSPPEELRNRPQQQLFTEEGPFLDGRLRVQAGNNRIDWMLLPALDNPRSELPVVGPYDVLEQGFRELMRRWLVDCPPVNRLAYGGVLLLPVGSLPDAYRRLDGLLPAVEIDPENTRDFTYRINRRRVSRCSVEELKINCLSTWSVVQIIETLVDLSADGQQTQKVVQRPGSRSICRLEIDINTAPEFNLIFDKDVVSALFEEIVDIGNEIATEGDVR